MILFYILLLLFFTAASSQPAYSGPVIGILTQKTYGKMAKLGNSYLAASYVKFIESSGAQVVPIVDSWDFDQINKTLHSVNGVLLPGGGQYLPDSRYYQAGEKIYQWAKDMNRKGIYFPVWGTCLGFELMMMVEANGTHDIRFNCSSVRSNNLTLQDEAQQSRTLVNLDVKLYVAIQSEQLVYNSHHHCINPDALTDPDSPIIGSYNLLATNWDENGHEFVALVEHKSLPFYGSQFHPEKPGFEWTPYLNIPHSRDAVYFAQYLANFFVDEVVKNNNKFADPNEFYKTNIENFTPVYTLKKINSTFVSSYFFKGRREDKNVIHF